MKTKEEIEHLAENYYIIGDIYSDYSTEEEQSAAESGFIDGYTQCQEDMTKNYTEAEIQQVLDGFTNEAPGQYIKTNFIDLLKKQK